MIQPTFLEFFAGGGMAREGLGRDWNCLFANDFDEAKAAAYAARWGEDGKRPAELKVDDVGKLSVDDLPAQGADLAWASFPCQDLSLAGNGAGLSGERSSSFMPFYFLMRGLRQNGRAPRMIVLENVCGLLTSHDGSDFSEICSMLDRIGYRFGAIVMDAVEFLPQSRPRLFIVAVDRAISVPSAQGPGPRWHPARLRYAHDHLRADLKAEWLWFDPPAPPKRDTRLIDIIEEVSDGAPWHSREVTARLLGMMNEVNRAKVDAAAALSSRTIGAVYKRTRVEGGVKAQRAEVRFDDVAGCLRTPGGGSSRQTIVVVDGDVVRSRLLTPRETARLMGLPDDYPLPGRYNDACHLTGDGVAVPVVRHIAEWILEPILVEQELRPIAIAAE